jgi:hypothetical protein
MEFRLFYEGKLKGGQSKDKRHVHDLRLTFHQQLQVLWRTEPFSYYAEQVLTNPTAPKWISHLDIVGGFAFSSLIHSRAKLVAHLDIVLMRPSPPGSLFGHGGDIDNRVKTLLDALRLPKLLEIPSDWTQTKQEAPLHCLLEDDQLVTGLTNRNRQAIGK